MIGTGWTVTTGDTPRPFRVKILGTLQDGIGPGRDLIVIKVSDLPGKHVISQGGGIWAGMSGSPVYLGSKLAGAVSYGFSNGPSRIGGMTPAGQMHRITTYSASTARRPPVGPAARRPCAPRWRTRRACPRRACRSLHRLAVPVVVTAAPGKLRNRLTTHPAPRARQHQGAEPAPRRPRRPPRHWRRRPSRVATWRASSPAATSPSPRWAPRHRSAATRCSASVTRSRATARSPSVLPAPSPSPSSMTRPGTPFKLANIGHTFGLLDQDRQSGIRATVGSAPRSIPVSARVRATDSGYIRLGRTSVTTSSWVPIVAANHLLYDIIAATDSEGAGTAAAHLDHQGDPAQRPALDARPLRPGGQHGHRGAGVGTAAARPAVADRRHGHREGPLRQRGHPGHGQPGRQGSTSSSPRSCPATAVPGRSAPPSRRIRATSCGSRSGSRSGRVAGPARSWVSRCPRRRRAPAS